MNAALREAALFSWFRPLTSLKGVGTVTLEALSRLLPPMRGVAQPLLTLRDLVFHLPYEWIDRTQLLTIEEATLSAVATLEVQIDAHYPPPRRTRLPYRVAVSDATGAMLLTFFHARSETLSKMLPLGQKRLISGRVELYDGMKQISHPDRIAPLHQRSELLTIEPQYPLVAGLSQRVLGRLISQALGLATDLPEWSNPALVKEHGWAGFLPSLRTLHHPLALADVAEEAPARLRLAYDEALAHQLALSIIRRFETRVPSPLVPFHRSAHEAFLQALPFALTAGQQAAIEAMIADMGSGERMVRLLQGDVGSGKTVVALAVMAQLAASQMQSVLMAPTDLLARQHEQSLRPLAESLGLELVFLSGKLSTSARKTALEAIASGKAQIVVGTHALFQSQVQFHRLGLVVVDEQHRFGVEQRLRLSEKGQWPHLLQMSATPIPRSLTMTAYGDMEVSLLTEKPAGRQPIDTRTIPITRADEMMDAVARALAQGQKLYWICPLIEQSDPTSTAADMAAVEERYRVLNARFGDVVRMVHGRMKPEERESIMQEFAFGAARILVATTVVEVGVNVPDATIMVIEQAERFGLAQLHQLRGRVGRGSLASRCVLLYDPNCSALAKERLATIRASNDGFFIAEEDLRLRGAGDVLGTRQTGLPVYRFLDLLRHGQLVRTARDDARHFLLQDAELVSERGKACRILLELFGYNEEIRQLRSA